MSRGDLPLGSNAERMTEPSSPIPSRAEESAAGGAAAEPAPIFICVREGHSRGIFRSYSGDVITAGRSAEADFILDPDDVQVSRGIHFRVEIDGCDSTRRRAIVTNLHKNSVQIDRGQRKESVPEGGSVAIEIPVGLSIGHGAGSIALELCTEAELGSSRTSALLLRSWAGDDGARADLIEEHLPYILERVRKRMGAGLRVRADSLDMAQEAALRFLRGDAPIVTNDPARLRAFLAKVVENTLRDENDRQTAAKRDRRREHSDRDRYGVLLDLPHRFQDTPSEVAMKLERSTQLELALKLIDPEDAAVITLRDFEQLGFAEIGEQVGVSENAARMRYQRALPRLRSILDDLWSGSIDQSLGE